MKPYDVKSSAYIEFNKKNNKENPQRFLERVRLQSGLKKFL